MQTNTEKIKITFPCPLCNKNHSFELNKDKITSITSFPFSYVFNHGDKSLLIYIDKDNKVRGVEKIDLIDCNLKENEISILNKVDGIKIKGKFIKDKKLGNIFIQL